MLIGGISFGQKTIWDEIAENIKAAELELDKAFDRVKEESEGEKEPDEADMLVESLLNYKDVLEGKVRALEEDNKNVRKLLLASLNRRDELLKSLGEANTDIEKLYAEIERQDEEIERLQNENDSKAWKIELSRHNINTLRARCREEAIDLFDREMWGLLKICRADENGRDAMYNQLLKNTEGEARELFVRHLFYNLKCVPANQKCDCGNFKKQIEELQAEIRDLTAENVKLATTNNHLKNAIHIKEQGSIIGDKIYEELKEKYETADLEREHLAKENEKLKDRIKALNDRRQQDCIDLNKKQTTIDELVDSYSELRRTKGLSE